MRTNGRAPAAARRPRLLRPFRELSAEERCAALASWVLVFWGAGHLIVIDLLPLVFGIYLYEVDPAVLQVMRETPLRFSFLGQTNLYVAFYGLSFWLALSLIGFGALNVLLANSSEVGALVRRRIYLVDMAVTACFVVIAALCFFALPVVGGALALVLYGLAFCASRREGRAAPGAGN